MGLDLTLNMLAYDMLKYRLDSAPAAHILVGISTINHNRPIPQLLECIASVQHISVIRIYIQMKICLLKCVGGYIYLQRTKVRVVGIFRVNPRFLPRSVEMNLGLTRTFQ